MDPVPYTVITKDGTYTVPNALPLEPGLVLFRLPDGMAPTNPRRWRIGHIGSGLAIADAMRREDGIRSIKAIAALTDWTQDAETVKAGINTDELFTVLLRFDCCQPNADRMSGNVSHNGRYTEADIQQAARAAAEEQMDGLELISAMAHTVPWMGLDTEPFNEAHSRILAIANPAEVAA
ncbi:hypothetical protein PUR59_30570 [Streptomyces sp. SP18ES09]|uniref:hypothetical protein n=1 Tax=Streptomyces sp. SP18ES09 TaxID=3002532 RepID=UPI002E7A51E3|nr:hypothetical protein [Streptomyces sp. SP18ES09]MEE1819346.1 hypothetical protein [Streptomyces sp. SP18ES09]